MRQVWRSGLAGLILTGILSFGAAAQEAEIEDVISRQIEAFRADDYAAAFEFASPQLQMLFGTAENFRRMVTEGYPMVRRPEALRFLELREDGAIFWQKVQITDPKGQVHVLEYRMEQTDAHWRIAAVNILPLPGVAV